ncbi:MAG: hypothetical protein V1740_03895 [Candidatus Woesearchaeota archaeon]
MPMDMLGGTYECQTHGRNCLTIALDKDGELIKLPDALKDKSAEYFCPNPDCGVRLSPEGGTKVISRDYWRRGHFNAYPEKSPESIQRYQGPKRESIAHLVRDSIAEGLRYSGDFQKVLVGADYKGEFVKTESFPRQYDLDIFARRGGEDSLDMVLHILELPLEEGSLNDVYSRIRELQSEPIPSEKLRYIKDSDGEWLPLGKRIHQNFVVIKNDHSWQRKSGASRVELVPSVYNFLGFLTDNSICYCDPTSLNLEIVDISCPKSISGLRHGQRKSFNVHVAELPYFSFAGLDAVVKEKDLVNWPGKKSVSLKNWKLAQPIEIDVDDKGNPVSVTRLSGQIEFLF